MDMTERTSSLGILLLVFINLFLSNSVLAQQSSVTVSGTIKDKVSNEPLSFVNVVLKKSTDSSLYQAPFQMTMAYLPFQMPSQETTCWK
jgi:hypothetical protein